MRPTSQHTFVGDDMGQARRLFERGEFLHAADLCRHVLTQCPDRSDALHVLALAAKCLGERQTAINALQRLAAIHPESAPVHNDLGLIRMEEGLIEEAMASLQRALELSPLMADAHYNLGLTFKSAGDLKAARQSFETVLRLSPGYAKAHFSIGELLHAAQGPAAALDHYRKAIQAEPGYIAAANHLAICLGETGRLHEAVETLELAARNAPKSAETMCNLGNAYRRIGRFDAAQAMYCRATAIKPDFAAAHFNLGIILLLQGDYECGWPEYEWRLHQFLPGSGYPNRFGLPLWQGEDLSAKTILVYDEQGFGDVFMFARYIALLRKAGACIALEVRRALHKLFTVLECADELLIREENQQPRLHCDYCVPLASLPFRFKTSLADIPDDVPYIHADPAETEKWRHTFPDNYLHVGFVWSGSSIDTSRRCDPALFSAFSTITGVKCHGLQKDAGGGVIAGNFNQIAPDLIDFADTAAVIANLDLIVTIDTAVAHLAGAMGKPAWVLLPEIPDWCWLLARDDSPWYPTVKLYRQPERGNWEAVIQQLERDLTLLAEGALSSAQAHACDTPQIPLEAYFSKAVHMQRSGDIVAAELFYRKVLKADPDIYEAYFNLAGIAYCRRNLKQAADLFRKVLELKPDFPEAAFNLARVMEERKEYDTAIEAYRLSLVYHPAHFPSANNLGLLLLNINHPAEAIESLALAVRLKPNDWMPLNNLGLAYHRAGRLEAALSTFESATKLAPEHPRVWQNMGNAHMDRGELHAMRHCYCKALELTPEDAAAHYSFGKLCLEHRHLHDARTHFQEALRLNPDMIEAHLDLGFTLLHEGQYQLGWKELEWRFRSPHRHINIYPFEFEVPCWQGERFTGKTLLVHSEQGFGDTIQFARFLPAVKARGGHVIFEVHSALVRLFEQFPGADGVRAIPEHGPPQSNFDMYIPLMSLGLHLDNDEQTFATGVPYLAADPHLAIEWRERCRSNQLHVGIAWSSNPIQKTSHRKSCSPAHFEALADIDGIRWCSLQKNAENDTLRRLANKLDLDDWAADFGDFADTAAALQNLDLIITIDTAIAHLAGALGRPAWLLLCYYPDWRWKIEGQDSPWYPTLKLIRQPKPGDWEAVFQKVRTMLMHLKKN
jgi:tetratricopeptide (TPR) repeat protein